MKNKTVEQLADEYADGKSSSEVFKKAHRDDFLAGYDAAKEDKKQILDLLNKYKSWYADETRCKIGKTPNYQRELELKSKIEILIELQNKLSRNKKSPSKD